MITFESTEIAFAHKSNKELRKANFLFKTMASNFMVKFGKVMTNFALKIHFPVGWIFKPTIYSHFVGGETIEDCEKNVRILEKYNVKAILDYSVEGEASEENIKSTLAETLKSIRNAASDKNIPFAVFKPTAFAADNILEIASFKINLNEDEQKQADLFRERVDLLCKTAFENDIPILIDAEDYVFQKFIDEVIYDMMEKYNKQKAIVFNTLQMYRWDRLDFLKKSLTVAKVKNFVFGAKFVRGAYMEKERELAEKNGYKSPIQINKENTDKDYNSALKFSIENIEKINIFSGSHNEDSNRYLAELMEKHKIEKNDSRVYFAQLYGMSDHISFNLAKEGYNVAKYVPYGPVKHVMPYLIRRAEENTSVAGQTGRELMLIKKEKLRRKTAKK